MLKNSDALDETFCRAIHREMGADIGFSWTYALIVTLLMVDVEIKF